MSVSPSTPKDTPQLVELINSSFSNNNGAGSGWTHQAHLVTGQRIDPADPNPQDLIVDHVDTTILKYEENQEIIGCVKLEIRTKESSKTKVCDLGILCVSPNAQGKGIGKKLMVAAENWARSKSIYVMEIDVVNERQDLLQFYERNGYVRTGETRPYPVIPGIRVPIVSGMNLVYLEKVLSK